MRVLLYVALSLGLAFGCSCEEETPAPRPQPPPRPPEPIAGGRRLADAQAFDLVPTTGGALLFFAPPFTEGGGLRVQRLGPTGNALESDRSLRSQGTTRGTGAGVDTPSQIVEVIAASRGSRLGVAWIVETQDALTAEASHSLDSGGQFLPVQPLAPSVRQARGIGGRLSLAASHDGTFVVHHRIPHPPSGPRCTLTPGPCALVDRHTIGDGRLREAVRDTSLEEVDSPCDPLVSDALNHEGTWFYALCHAAQTRLFVIDPSPPLATPLDVGQGCTFIGLAPLDSGTAAVSACGSRIELSVISDTGEIVATVREAERTVACREGRPVLDIAGHELALAESSAALAPLLPDSIAPPGTRAIWTGEALLLGVPLGRDLSIRRYQCMNGERFERTDVD